MFSSKSFNFFVSLAAIAGFTYADNDAVTAGSKDGKAHRELNHDDSWMHNDLVDVAVNGGFSTLVTALQVAGFDDDLECNTYYWQDCERYSTVFAPTNAAFSDNAVSDVVDLYTTDSNYLLHLRNLLKYHIIGNEELSSNQILRGAPLETLLGDDLSASVDGKNNAFINDAELIKTDIWAKNGIIHVIDKLLLPSFIKNNIVDLAVSAGDFSELLKAATAAGLVDFLSDNKNPVTVFAPTDDAFKKISDIISTLSNDQIADVLKYHVVQGEIVNSGQLDNGQIIRTVLGEDIVVNKQIRNNREAFFLNNDARIVGADLLASNGIVHVIDEVLIPPSLASSPSDGNNNNNSGGGMNDDLYTIAEAVENDMQFDTLEAALKAAELLDVFSNSDGPKYTVFAPKDSAFGQLPRGTVDNLLKTPDVLGNILKYHVVPGEIFARDLQNGQVEMLNGGLVTVDVSNRGVYLNGNVRVVTPDVQTANGVIHIIDKVLIPKTIMDLAEELGFNPLVAAIDKAGLRETLSGPGPFTVLAPTNNGFQRLGPLNRFSGSYLADVLTYHVISGVVTEAGLPDGEVPTVQGDKIEITFRTRKRYGQEEDYVRIVGRESSANVVDTDIFASNGVIHVINNVLLPYYE